MPTGAPAPTMTVVPRQTKQSTAVVVPADLAFASRLVQVLDRSGLDVLAVRGSTFMSIFQSTNEAARIETNNGIVDVVFFATPEEASRISIRQSPNASVGRFIYIIQAPPPTMLHDQRMDAAFPLYFTVGHGMFMATSSLQLDKILKQLFAER